MQRILHAALCAITLVAFGCDRAETASSASGGTNARPVAHLPEKLDPECREGVAKLYDECSDQREILSAALERAKSENKPLLVVYGAEWCIWCHVVEKYIAGEYGQHVYEFEHTSGPLQMTLEEELSETTKADAAALNQFVAENFVVGYIEGQYAPGGEEAIASTGVDTSTLNYFPVIMSVGHDGKVARVMDSYSNVPKLEIRESGGEEYRGLNRKVFLSELRALHRATK